MLNERIQQILEVAGRKLHDQFPSMYWRYRIEPGRKYIKVATGHSMDIDEPDPTQWSVWCFVDKNTGDVYKPASWKAPAKGIRYNLLDDASFKVALQKADPYGSWLYLRK